MKDIIRDDLSRIHSEEQKKTKVKDWGIKYSDKCQFAQIGLTLQLAISGNVRKPKQLYMNLAVS